MNSYTITDLGPGPDGGFPKVTAINEQGVAVGALGINAVRKGGILERLEGPSAFSKGEVATGINDSTPEIICGNVDTFTSTRACVWIKEEYHDLHELLNKKHPNLGPSWAEDVNDNGIVLGRRQNKAFRLNLHTDEVELLAIEDPFIIGRINTHGNVVGWTSVPGEPHGAAFLYDSTVNVIPAPTPDGRVATDKFDINDSDFVVSNYYTSTDAASHAFLYDPTQKKSIDLHPLDCITSVAYAINNQNQVVGWTVDKKGDQWATIWTLDEGSRKLNNLLDDPINEWNLLEAYDINDKGQIIGYGTNSGQPRAFLLDPAPTPGPGSLDLSLGDLKMEMKIFWLPGGIGLRLGGGYIYPKGPPVDPNGPFRVLEPFQRDALTGLAIQALARNISDPQARLLAENSGSEVIRMATAHSLSRGSAERSESGCLSLLSGIFKRRER